MKMACSKGAAALVSVSDVFAISDGCGDASIGTCNYMKGMQLHADN